MILMAGLAVVEAQICVVVLSLTEPLSAVGAIAPEFMLGRR